MENTQNETSLPCKTEDSSSASTAPYQYIATITLAEFVVYSTVQIQFLLSDIEFNGQAGGLASGPGGTAAGVASFDFDLDSLNGADVNFEYQYITINGKGITNINLWFKGGPNGGTKIGSCTAGQLFTGGGIMGGDGSFSKTSVKQESSAEV